MFNDCILYISKYNGNTMEVQLKYMEIIWKLYWNYIEFIIFYFLVLVLYDIILI